MQNYDEAQASSVWTYLTNGQAEYNLVKRDGGAESASVTLRNVQ